jgi:hypothetical protein
VGPPAFSVCTWYLVVPTLTFVLWPKIISNDSWASTLLINF